ncbi:MAG: redoxin domain-containing protein [Armatimonadia bacterium]|nr:redoxin domain-containing protein [Armatimonadia bacterium]
MRRRTEVVDAPDFPEGLQWLNTDGPLTLDDLRGKAVLLSFWTSCCIHCAHVVPELNHLAREFAPELVVIGVHAPKCTGERDPEQTRLAVQRSGIEYPVVNDREMRIWQSYGIRAWPTTVLLNPAHRVAERVQGEAVVRRLGDAIGDMIRDASRSGGMSHEPLACRTPDTATGGSGLVFPAGITADERTGRLFIADTGANRIVVADFGGEVLEVVGTGHPGLDEGRFEDATFSRPRGVTLDGSVLYVADSGNHAIRSVDFDSRRVTRVAGTGEAAPALMRQGPARGALLNSPWDVEVVHHRLYVTMAGAHQIWRLDLHSGEMEAYAGGGSAGFQDGTRGTSMLCQPSGLTHDGVRLFFTDAGSSSIRWVYLPPAVQLSTWVGKGVFEYGDRDGPGRQALLQNPLGLIHHIGSLYVADSFNNKIKRLNPRLARLDTILGTGEAGFEDGERATLNQPHDLTCADERLWIADTNNHAIRVAPVGGGPVSTLELYPEERLQIEGC